MIVVLHVAAELRFLLPARHRGPAVAIRYDGTSSLGHVIESAGVPLTEVGPLLVDGVPAAPATRLAAGAHVCVPAVARPQPLPPGTGFLLDVHLGTLARRLRLLGVDAAYRNDADDAALVARSLHEDRVLLTRDRGLLRRRRLRRAAYVRGQQPAQQLADVLDRFAPPLAPYRRCLACGALLEPVPKAEIAPRLPAGTRRSYQEFARCPACDRVYWRGAHARSLDAVVASVSG